MPKKMTDLMPKKGNMHFLSNISHLLTKSCFLLVWYVVMLGVSSAATMGTRFFNTGLTQSLAKRDMFRAGEIPLMLRGWQTRECVGSLVPQQCNKSNMFPNFVRSLAFSSASQSSGQTPRQEPKKKENKILSREICDEISSTKVSLNQFPGLLVHGMVENSKVRHLLRLNPDTGYFEQEQDVAAAANNHDHSHHSELQVPHGHVCRGSAFGWLFLTDENLDMKLFNPFSGAEIQLPPMNTFPRSKEYRHPFSQWFVYKAALSANPSVEPRPVVLIHYAGYRGLAFCKPGDKGWTPLEFPIKRHFQWCYVYPKDVIYHKGQFYVLSHPGYVAAFDIGRCIDDDDHTVKTTLVATAAKRELIYGRDWHLVVLDGELIRFELKKLFNGDETKEIMEKERMRDGDTTDEDYTDAKSDEDYDFNYADADEDTDTETDFSDEDTDTDSDEVTETDSDDHNSDSDSRDENENENEDDDGDNKRPSEHHPHLYGIKIRRFDVSEQQWVKVESLGDKAVFLGYNTSFVLSASDYPAGHCIPNSIYFTDGSLGNENTEKVCYDMGIYNVKDKSVKRPLYLPTQMDDDDVSQFKKPAPIWIVKSTDG